MKINHLRISNFVGARDIDLALETPITIFAGRNGAGKSSLREGIRAALTGDVDRVTVKKAHGALVTEGEKRAGVTLGTDHGEASIVITPSETKWTGLPMNASALPFVLDPSHFSRLTPDARRTFLFELTGLSATTESVRKQLLDRGNEPQKVETVLPLLRAGFPAANESAKKRATEAKGAWRALSGEVYGEKKAETWVADRPLYDTARLSAGVKQLEEIDKKLASYNKTLGIREEKAKAYAASKQAEQGGAAAAETLTRARAKLAADENFLAQAEKNLLEAQQRAGSQPREGLVHELAAVLADFIDIVTRSEGVAGLDGSAEVVNWDDLDVTSDSAAPYGEYLSKYGAPGAVGDPETLESLPALVSARDLMTKSVANSMRDLRAAETAVAALDLQGNVEAITQADVDAMRTAIEAAQRERQVLQGDVEKLRRAQQAAEVADQRTADAAKHHADVLAWSKIADALAPDGIPGQMLEQALKPINGHLREYSVATDWLRPVIESDMTITAADRPFALLSESEQWRVDTMIAVAIAHLSGLRMVVLDRVDVLDLPARGPLFDWLDELSSFGVIDTAILCGTLKAVPAVLTDPDRDFWQSIRGFWIEDGRLVRSEELAATA